MKKIGITTTVPVEVLIAAGYQPVDLNNVLVGDARPGRLITTAERDGFPLNSCSWIKGIYGVCRESGIRNVLGVTGGDCSNTLILMEVLKLRRINTIPFAYPTRPHEDDMKGALLTLAATLGTTLEAAERVRARLMPCRDLALILDEFTWKDNIVSGGENHLWLVSSSDFNGDFLKYERQLRKFLAECSHRQPYPSDQLRLAYIGVPPVYAADLYRYLEKHSGRVVFNEVQRQFAMPEPVESLVEQYTRFTYPYSVQKRLEDIKTELTRRHIDGVIHYTQAFCHRAIGDIIFREAIDLPLLTLEGNDDFYLNSHIKTRLEAFLDMIRQSRTARQKKPKHVNI